MNENEPEQKWHPIKSAPRDKTVWIWHPQSQDYSLAYFHSMRGRWVLMGDPNYAGPNHINPSMWHPLPEPPCGNAQRVMSGPVLRLVN